MKLPPKRLFSTITLIGFISLLVISIPIIPAEVSNISPITSNSQFLDELISSLQHQNLNYHHLETKLALNQVSFYLEETKVYLSTQKNPEDQVLVLPQILKHAKIKKQTLETIDLSSDHPYATFKNY